MQQRFERTVQDSLALKAWILEHKCDVVACESTSDYWVHIYDLLIDHVPVLVGNAHDIKVLSHKKTDKIDSEMIAQLALKGMISPSRVMPRYHRDFRKMVRLRHFLVEKRTDIKNRIHSILDGELFPLATILTDIFGVSGQRILHGILRGASADEILKSIPLRTRLKKENEIRALIDQNMSRGALLQLRHCLRVIKHLDEEIGQITEEVQAYTLQNYPREYAILRTVPGVGDITAITLIAEIGNFRDFISGEKLASWIGIVPRVHQSANHIVKRSITKRGSRHARGMITQAAHAAAKSRKNLLREWYETKKRVIGAGKATIALARKMIVIIWHLIVNDEEYVDRYSDPSQTETKTVHTIRIPVSPHYTLEEVLGMVAEAVHLLNKRDPDPA
ncbi:IS110 family transposase [Methanoculleus sp. FWC-SCC1]|uniref:IS110 family transposase n=1 Tax=Methanoculleus frigidifontis TaxID=2584085 RepID=A0ABT8M7F2_9EURY|nr:IS110 family transposase [Methanoculleus sp. FWC-SCC1]MDN7023851.1 IS110 family transposase [Methanoculleus sp. FWC-SCC1]